jgi:hypothetical protein
MNTMTAAIISMAATAAVWANTVEAIFLDASFMALPLHPWFARQTARRAELRSRVIVAENGAMTPRFLRRTPQDCIRPHVSPRDEYDMRRLDHQCGGILSRTIMLAVARRHIASHMERLRITATRKA